MTYDVTTTPTSDKTFWLLLDAWENEWWKQAERP